MTASEDDTPERRKDYVLEEQAGHLLRRAYQRHVAIFQGMIGESQLTPLQFAALVRLRDLSGISQNQLGRLTAMDAATMQGVIKRLVDRGLIERQADPEDRRRLILSLSKAGRALVENVIGNAHRITAETLKPLSSAERRTFLKLLARIAE